MSQTAEQPKKIKNKDIPLLSRVRFIMQEVYRTEKRREWQQDRMFSITQKLTGMPGGGGVPKGFDTAFAALEEADDAHKKNVIEYCRELKTAERIINDIPSLTMRTFVVLFYVDGLTKKQVMAELNMPEWGFRRARESIEQATDMTHVVWRERYYLEQN